MAYENEKYSKIFEFIEFFYTMQNSMQKYVAMCQEFRSFLRYDACEEVLKKLVKDGYQELPYRAEDLAEMVDNRDLGCFPNYTLDGSLDFLYRNTPLFKVSKLDSQKSSLMH